MSRVAVSARRATTNPTADVYLQIKKTVANVPNTFAVIRAHGPATLKAMLLAGTVLATSSLSKQDQETIKLAVSVAIGCDYCEAAHSVVGQSAGLAPDVIKRICAGHATGDAKRDALLHFVRLLVLTPRAFREEEFSAIKTAGYSDAQLVDISLALSVIGLINVFNRKIDVPAAA